MSYLVLARKYRPQTFSELVGQDVVVKTLQSALAQGRIHHAFLLCGARGTGKTTTARILAKALCCDRAPTPNPCNVCASCIEITSGQSVDVQEIDAASQNKVEDIRELRESIRYAPLRGKKKIYILDEVHMLSTSAFNALLKTLEEPPPHAVFIFATTDPQKLPATILSRVQRYDFRLVPFATLVDHVGRILDKEGIAFDPKALLMIAREGGGSVRDALSLLDQVLAFHTDSITQALVAETLGIADRAFLFSLADAIVAKQPEQALLLVSQAASKGYDLFHVAKALLEHIRNIVVALHIPNPADLIEATPDEIALLQQQAAVVGTSFDFLFQRMLRITEEVGKSPFPRYTLEIGLVELCLRDEFVPLDQLVQSLGPGAPSAAGTHAPQTSPRTRPAAPVTPTRVAPTATAPPAQTAQEDTPPYPAARPVESPPSQPSVGQDTAPADLPWEQIVQRVVQENPLLHMLALCRLLSSEGDLCVVGVPQSFLLDALRDKKSDVEQALAKHVGKPLRVQLALDPHSQQTGGESLLAAQERKENEDKERKRQQALSHPARDHIRQAFGDGVIFHEPKLE